MIPPVNRRARHVLRGRGKPALPAWAAVAGVMALSAYIVQRALYEIALGIGRSPWQRIQFGPTGLCFSHVVMTVGWPLVLALLCRICRRIVAGNVRTAAPVWSALAAGAAAPGGAAARQESAGLVSRGLWNTIASGPAAAVGLHMTVGFWSLGTLVGRDVPRGGDHGTVWLLRWLLPAMLTLTGACVVGFWGARQFFTALEALGATGSGDDRP